MSTNKSRIIAVLLTAALTLSLLLAACNKGSDNPTGDNSTPGTSSAPSGGDTTKPDTWTDYYVADPKEKVFDEPETPNTEKKAELDDNMAVVNSWLKIDVDEAINRVYEKYGEYLNVNITKNVIRVICVIDTGKEENYLGISDTAMNKVNDFLKNKGKEPLDIKNPEQNIAAMWIAISLYFDPDYTGEHSNLPYYYLAWPYSLVRIDGSRRTSTEYANDFWSIYVTLFDLF